MVDHCSPRACTCGLTACPATPYDRAVHSWIRFACSVARVLRPGGVLAWADLANINLGLDPKRTATGLGTGKDCCGLPLVNKVIELLGTIGFELHIVEDLMLNVLLSQQENLRIHPAYVDELSKGSGAAAFNVSPNSAGWKVLLEQTKHYPMIIASRTSAAIGTVCNAHGNA